MNVTTLLLSAVIATSCALNVNATESSGILITNANIFNGISDKLSQDMDVLIEGNKISKIGRDLTVDEGVKVIDANGRTLTPGFIDAHVHLFWNRSILGMLENGSDYHAATTLKEAEATLMRGFTTVRDTGGNVFGVRKAIDEGLFPGPRILASGAAISMTAGHGDFRFLNELPRAFGGPAQTPMERVGGIIFADGVDEMLVATREQMRHGANFIKVFVGGAVSGLRDPLDIAEYSDAEISAAVGEAERWNTYVAVHAYTDRSVRTALNLGVKSIEHANLLTKETLLLAKKKGAFISAQTGVFLAPAPDSFSEAQKARHKIAADGLDTMMSLAAKYKVKVGFGSDFIEDPELKKLQLQEFTNRLKWFTPVQILKQATSVNAELLELSGPRHPYREGKLGVIEVGAYADILLINGNPLVNMEILLDYDNTLALIMKDGIIYKSTIK